jgi:hypothetical protein
MLLSSYLAEMRLGKAIINKKERGAAAIPDGYRSLLLLKELISRRRTRITCFSFGRSMRLRSLAQHNGAKNQRES